MYHSRCPLLHRVYGDAEKRYHLRYYKTTLCQHETDDKGCCKQNGSHCSFAHGESDRRKPVYDIKGIQNVEQAQERERAQAIQEDSPLNGKLYSFLFCLHTSSNRVPKYELTEMIVLGYFTVLDISLK